MSKSTTTTMIIKFIVFLIINAGFFLDESDATKFRRPFSEGPSPSPMTSRRISITTLNRHEKLSPQYKHFLAACERRMTEKCANEILHEIFENKTITKKCCSKLVDMGPDCHRIMIQREEDLIKNKEEKNMIISRSETLWERCSKITPMKKNRHYPRVPPREYLPGYEKFLEGCAKELKDKCGTQVLEVVFENKKKNVDKGCCKKLLKMGYNCHHEMLVRLEHLATKKSDKNEVKKKGHQMWKHCEGIVGHN